MTPASAAELQRPLAGEPGLEATASHRLATLIAGTAEGVEVL